MHRGEDAKRQSLLRLGDFDLYKKFVDILSLFKRNILISPLEGEKKFLSELRELSNKGRLGILAQREAGFDPSLLSGEGIDSVVSFALKSKNLTTHENNSFKRVLEKPKVNAGNILSKLEFISKIL